MNYSLKQCVMVMSLLLLLTNITACSLQETPKPVMPEGKELVKKMETAVKSIKNGYLKIKFQMATSKGGVGGQVEAWGERPDKLRAEVFSQSSDIDRVVVSTDNFAGWIYSPAQKTFYFSKNYPGSPYLQNQPELLQLVQYARQVWEQGTLGDFEATTESSAKMGEGINERTVYKVKVVPKNITMPDLLSNATLYIWIDQITFLPQQVQIEAKFGEDSGKGVATVQEMTTNRFIESSVFQFQPPPDDFFVVNLDLAPLEFPSEKLPNPDSK